MFLNFPWKGKLICLDSTKIIRIVDKRKVTPDDFKIDYNRGLFI